MFDTYNISARCKIRFYRLQADSKTDHSNTIHTPDTFENRNVVHYDLRYPQPKIGKKTKNIQPRTENQYSY